MINPPPAGAPFPGLYVPPAEFAAQMEALKAAGWHAVTMDQLEAYWKRGVPLGPGKPIVLTFDNGYHSQYTAALPVLKHLGWVADENIQLSGLPPSQGGLTTDEVRGPGMDHAHYAFRALPDAPHELWPKPAEIAAVLAFLVGDDAALISGASIPVYGRV